MIETMVEPTTFQHKSMAIIGVDGIALELCTPVLEMAGKHVELCPRPVAALNFEAVSSWGRWRWQWTGIDGHVARFALEGPSAESSQIFADWRLVLPFAPIACDHILTQGDSMGGCQSLAASGIARDFQSAGMLLLRCGQTILLLEFPPSVACETQWSGHYENGVVSELHAVVSERFAQSDSFPRVELEVRSGTDVQKLLRQWGIRHAGERRLCSGATAGFAGWNSWDYYRWSVTADDVLANAEFIARDPVLARRIKRLVIDDGWMYCYGEWEPNSRFGDMGALARELRKMGFIPGLWLAPGIAEPQSMIAQRHWQFLARGVSGWPCLGFECMERRGFLLDPTRREVQKWLFDLFRRYRDMGFGYFKLDFLKQTLNARRFADRRASAGDIMRCLLRPISEAAGPDVELMGCNYPLATGSCYVDVVRMASDIHATFEAVRHNSVSVAARAALHQVRWRNDPDFALLRGPETCDDPDLKLLRPSQVYVTPDGNGPLEEQCGNAALAGDLGIAQARILLGLILISGGEINFSDCMTKLNAAGLDLARRIAAAPVGSPGVADDLMEAELAGRYTQHVTPKLVRRLLINWSDHMCRQRLPDAPWPEDQVLVTDFWTDETLAVAAAAELELPPRSSRLLEYRFRES